MQTMLLPGWERQSRCRLSELVELSWSQAPLQIPCQLVTHRGKWLSPALTALLVDLRAA